MSALLRLRAVATAVASTVVVGGVIGGMVVSEGDRVAQTVASPAPTEVPTLVVEKAPTIDDFSWRVLGETGMTEVRATISNVGAEKAVNVPFTCTSKSGKKVYTGELNGLAEKNKVTVIVITTPEDYTELGAVSCTPGTMSYR